MFGIVTQPMFKTDSNVQQKAFCLVNRCDTFLRNSNLWNWFTRRKMYIALLLDLSSKILMIQIQRVRDLKEVTMR